MTNTPDQAIAAARDQSLHGPAFGVGLCLQRVRICYGVGASAPDATAAWHATRHRAVTRNPREIPRGAPVWWTGGRHGHGHVAIAAGGGMCWSTDFERPGFFDLVPIGAIEDGWGVHLEGWSSDLNGVTVWAPELTRGRRIDEAIRLLEHVQGKARRAAAARALAILRKLPQKPRKGKS